MRLIEDYEHHYRGYWSDGGVCRVQVFVPEAGKTDRATPVVIVTELKKNENTSVTNICEYLAAELVELHRELRRRPVVVDRRGKILERPFVHVEHYPEEGRGAIFEESWSIAEFDSYAVEEVVVFGGVRRAKLGNVSWRPATRAGVEALVGQELGDAPARARR